MPNPLILFNSAAAATQAHQLINAHNKALFVVLGDTPAHHALAQAAAAQGVAFQHAVLITNPALVEPVLMALPKTATPVPDYDDWIACCISISGEIVEIYTTFDQDNIVPCFLLAGN